MIEANRLMVVNAAVRVFHAVLVANPPVIENPRVEEMGLGSGGACWKEMVVWSETSVFLGGKEKVWLQKIRRAGKYREGKLKSSGLPRGWGGLRKRLPNIGDIA
jgi:hypothetical protein